MMEIILSAIHGMHPLFQLGLLLLAGYWGGRGARVVGLPRISGYIVSGMFLSPSITGILPRKLVTTDLHLVTEIALGIIAFSIGGALEIDKIKKLGRPILWITILQGLSVFFLVGSAVYLLFPLAGQDPGMARDTLAAVAIVLGAICAATAPAAVLSVVHEYRAKGPFTTVLLGVVTLDDGLTIILFSIAGGVAGSLMGTGESLMHQVFIYPAMEILLSMFIGVVTGLAFRAMVSGVRRSAALLCVSIGMIFIASGTALSLGASSLLACMTLGTVVANLVPHSEKWFEAVENIEEPIFSMFFVLAGAHLDLSALATAGWLAVIIITARVLGKVGGTRAGAAFSRAPEPVRRHLALGLLPQAGVSIGLVLAARDLFPDSAASDLMVNAVLASVVINELISPVLVKRALVRAGEVTVEED